MRWFKLITYPSEVLERGGREGCPFAPYLLLIVGEILNHMIKRALTNKEIRGVVMPNPTQQHIVVQYVDDTSYIVEGKE